MTEAVLSTPQPGYMIRTKAYKYISYNDDPVEQLFDMATDPGETKNLAGEGRHAGVLEDHRKLMREQWGRLDLAPDAPGPVVGG